MDKHLILELSKEIQERIETQMENGKMQRLQKFADENQHIDANRILAFALSEAKMFTTLYTTDFLMTLAEYEEIDKRAANGETLELPKEEPDSSSAAEESKV